MRPRHALEADPRRRLDPGFDAVAADEHPVNLKRRWRLPPSAVLFIYAVVVYLLAGQLTLWLLPVPQQGEVVVMGQPALAPPQEMPSPASAYARPDGSDPGPFRDLLEGASRLGTPFDEAVRLEAAGPHSKPRQSSVEMCSNASTQCEQDPYSERELPRFWQPPDDAAFRLDEHVHTVEGAPTLLLMIASFVREPPRARPATASTLPAPQSTRRCMLTRSPAPRLQRDFQCKESIAQAFARAAKPGRVMAAAIQQNLHSDPVSFDCVPACTPGEKSTSPWCARKAQMRVVTLDARHSTGPCYPRHVLSRM